MHNTDSTGINYPEKIYIEVDSGNGLCLFNIDSRQQI